MMTKLQKSPYIALEYEFVVTNADRDDNLLYTKKFLYQKTELFRVGLKVPAGYFEQDSPSYSYIMYFLTTNLQKTGLRVRSVLSNANIAKSKWIETDMKEMDLTTKAKTDNNFNESGGSQQQLFRDTLKLIFRTDVESCDFNFYGTVYLDGIVDNYRVHQMDSLLSQQLWSSITDELNGTDFQLISSDGYWFHAHKWVLAARSPVFAVLFSSQEKIGSLHLAVDCTVKELKQFIKFIYTGELEGLVGQELLQLAVKYQIKTLEDVCRTALQDDFSEDRMAVIALHLKSGSFSCFLDKQ